MVNRNDARSPARPNANGATGGWTVPLLILIVLLIPQAVAGVLVSRPRLLEDELDLEPTPTPV